MLSFLLFAMPYLGKVGEWIEQKSPFNIDYVVNHIAVYESGCIDIGEIDFKNFLFLIRNPDKIAADGTWGKFVLKEGIYEELNPFGGIEWRTEIEQDFLLQQNISEFHRFIITFSNHLGGSGSFTRLFVFRCLNGRLEEIFQAGGEGMEVSQLPENRLQIIFCLWEVKNSHAGPSKQKVHIYRWSCEQDKYILENAYIIDRSPY